MNTLQMKNWLVSEGFRTTNEKYYQRSINSEWYVDVVLSDNKAQVQAVHMDETKERFGMRAYDYTSSNHKRFTRRGIKANGNYVRNAEGHSFPLYIIPMAVETISNRLS